MALTRPKVTQFDTLITSISDPITVLKAGGTSANVDIGFVMNRANGLVANVALYWSESENSFATAFTSNTGSTNTNVTPGSYTTVTTGNLIPGSNVTYSLGTTTRRWKDLWLSGTTIYLGGATLSAPQSGIVTITNDSGGSFSVTGSAPGQASGTFGNLVANSGVASTSTTTGALQVTGGAGITGELYVGGNLNVSGSTNTINNTIYETTEYVITQYATSVYAATLGNIGANVVGTGTYLTSLNATNLASGTVPLARLSGITASQLSGSAGITNGQLANNSVTITAGTNLTDGGTVALGGTVTLNLASTVNLATLNAATVGNIGANVVGTGTYLTSLNGANLNSSSVPTSALVKNAVTITTGTGLSGGDTVTLGGTLILTNAGVLSITPGTGITANAATGSLLITNTGVTNLSSSGAGNLTISAATGVITARLTPTGPTTTVGSSTTIPIITTDGYGRVSALSTASISTTLATAGTTGTGSVALDSQTLTFAGQYGVTAAVSGSTVTVGTPQDLRSTANVTFGIATVSGNAYIGGDLTVNGNIVQTGNSFTINSSTLSTSDNAILLHYPTGGGNLTVDDGQDIGLVFNYYKGSNKYGALLLTSDESELEFYITGSYTGNTFVGTNYGTISAGGLNASNTTPSTSTITGALKVAGGAGIAGNLYVDKVYTTNGIYWAGNGYVMSTGGGASPSGSLGQVQYNNGGTLGASNLYFYSGNSATVLSTATTATSTTTGALQLLGGAGIAGNVYVGGGINTSAGLYATGAYNGGYTGDGLVLDHSNAFANPGARFSAGSNDGYSFYTGGIGVTELLRIDGTTSNIVIPASTSSVSTTTGALVVKGGVGIVGSVYAGPVYDSGTRVVSTSTGAGNLTISAGGINLTATGPGAVTTGSSTAIPVITTDVYGRIASITTSSVSTTINLAGTSGTGSVSGGGTLTFASSNGITATASGSTITISDPQDIRTTASPTFAGGNFTGNVTRSSRAIVTNYSGNVAPATPVMGDEWFRGNTGVMYKYLYDNVSNTYNWINISAALYNASTSATASTLALRDTGGNLTATNFLGTASSAKYADLAEIYESDKVYQPGTVVVFGGTKEITVTTKTHDTRVAGVISTNPAYLMNSEATGLPVAFTGRVPCLVKGPVTKGDVLVTSAHDRYAERMDDALYRPGCVLGKSLGEVAENEFATIEVVVGRF